MAKIRIIGIPPGFAPKEIREQWVGIEIPLTNPIPKGKESFCVGNSNKDGYQVKGTDAVEALINAKKTEAVNFWRPYSTGNFVFKKEICELIS